MNAAAAVNTSGGEEPGGFERVLPDDCVEYMLFVIDDQLDPRKLLSSLERVRRAAMQLADQLTKEYIWQRDGFALQTKNHEGLVYLQGSTEFGDSIEDEWLVVYILRELSKQFPDLWVRVADNDGEFVLIEAANVAPKWLNPEVDAHRAWIHQGHLRIIPPGAGQDAASKAVGLHDAVRAIKSSPDSLIASAFIEAEAFYRLEKYPAQITASVHCARAALPRKLAYILHLRPKAIAPAIEAFYLRDPVAMKPLLSASTDNLTFPPSDLVTVSVRFTKVLYAQLKSQRFTPPPSWKGIMESAESAAGGGEDAYRRLATLELGMKVTCGFEMAVGRAARSNNRLVREVALLLEDLAEDGDQALPSDQEIAAWEEVERDDDDSWLDIDYNDLERELGHAAEKPREPKFGDANAQADLRKIVSRFEAFLNDETAGIEGAELDEMDQDDDDDGDDDDDSDSEDKEVSFDEQEFSRMMREMMGFPSQDAAPSTRNRPTEAKQSDGQLRDETKQDDEGAEVSRLAEQMEAELRGHGALALDPSGKQPALVKANASGVAPEVAGDDSSASGEEEVDVDYNLAKNLLESFKGQAGTAGPASSILGMLGMGLPRDEDLGDED